MWNEIFRCRRKAHLLPITAFMASSNETMPGALLPMLGVATALLPPAVFDGFTFSAMITYTLSRCSGLASGFLYMCIGSWKRGEGPPQDARAEGSKRPVREEATRMLEDNYTERMGHPHLYVRVKKWVGKRRWRSEKGERKDKAPERLRRGARILRFINAKQYVSVSTHSMLLYTSTIVTP